MKLSRILLVTGFAAVLALSAGNVAAQGQGGGRGGRNFDPAQMKQRMVDRARETLDIKDDTEWKALEPVVTKIIDARMDIGFGGRGFGGPRNRGTNAPADQAQAPRPSFGTPNPAAEALQKAVDAKASPAELKTKLDAYRADVKAKEAKLEKAQEDLKKFLTPQQEAAAVLGGLLK